MNLLIGTKIAKELENKNTSLIIPDFKDNSNIIEVMTLLEAQINILIDNMKFNIEKEAEITSNPLASPGEVVSIFTSPHLSAGAPALGEAKGLINNFKIIKINII